MDPQRDGNRIEQVQTASEAEASMIAIRLRLAVCYVMSILVQNADLSQRDDVSLDLGRMILLRRSPDHWLCLAGRPYFAKKLPRFAAFEAGFAAAGSALATANPVGGCCLAAYWPSAWTAQVRTKKALTNKVLEHLQMFLPDEAASRSPDAVLM